VRLEAAGVPTVAVATTAFAALAHQTADAYGLPGARIAVVPHPLGAISAAAVTAKADEAVETVLGLLTGGA
jgi:hypothetical protein